VCFVVFIIIVIILVVSNKKKDTTTTVSESPVSTSENDEYPVINISDEPPPREPIIDPESGGPIVDPVTGALNVTVSKLLRILKDPTTYITLAVGVTTSLIFHKMWNSMKRAIEKSVLEYRLINSGERAFEKLAAKDGERLLERVGSKLVKRSAERLATRAAVRATTQAAARQALSVIPGAAQVEAAFYMFTGYMDAFNLGGFQDMAEQSLIKEVRDSNEQIFQEALDNEGIQAPVIKGPDIGEITDETLTALLEEELAALLPDIIARLNEKDPPPTDPEEWISSQIDEDDLYVRILCKFNNGIVVSHPVTGKKFCSLSKEKCVPEWPLAPGDTYYEWDKDKEFCKVTSSGLRTYCENLGMDVSYNQEEKTCNLTDKYCRRYGVADGVTDNDCKINKSQNIAETLLGTAFVRGVVNVFDFDNYDACPPGSHEPKELTALAAVPFYGLWAGPATGLASKYLCATNSCEDGEERMGEVGETGGMCYPTCDPGYSSQWNGDDRSSALMGACFKDCPAGYRGDVGACWRDLDVKIDTGVQAACPAGSSEPSLGFCDTPCRSRTDGKTLEVAGFCYHPSVERLAGGGVALSTGARRTCPEGKDWGDNGSLCMKCARGDEYEEGVCWDADTDFITWYVGGLHRPTYTCPDDYDWDGGVLCNLKIGAGSPKIRPKTDIGQCGPDREKAPGTTMCYKKCSSYGSEYYRTANGACEKGIIYEPRDGYTRDVKGSAYHVFPKKRNTPFPETTEENFKNSTLGKHYQAAINAARNGDPAGFIKAAAYAGIVGHPAVVGLGASDLADIGLQKAEKEI
jgi:hypothetical protein